MKLYIYRLEGCKTCTKRQPLHNKLASYMKSMGVEVIGVRFGNINGERVTPLPEHDQLCRKELDATKYQAPIYIIDDGDSIVKLPDMGTYSSVEGYVDAVIDIINRIQST